MNVIPVRVGQASSRGQCLTSSVKLRDLGDRWGRNEGEIYREDFDSSHFTARRWIEESIFKFSFFPLEEIEFCKFLIRSIVIVLNISLLSFCEVKKNGSD